MVRFVGEERTDEPYAATSYELLHPRGLVINLVRTASNIEPNRVDKR